MASLFISHASADRDAATAMAERIRGWGFASLFLDADPMDGIPVGSAWEDDLYAQLRAADGVVFLGSEAAVASRWCAAELALARRPQARVPGVGERGRAGISARRRPVARRVGARSWLRAAAAGAA